MVRDHQVAEAVVEAAEAGKHFMLILFFYSFLLTTFSYQIIITKPASQKQIVNPIWAPVDKKHSLGNYIPQDLVQFDSIQVSKRMVPDLKKLLKAAQKDGLELRAISGYRSYERQKKLFESYIQKELRKNKKLTRAQAEKIANNYSAQAGHSEHQLGTTVDILSSENNYQFDLSGNLKYIEWLEKNCGKYNFKISYQKDNHEYTYEPWHVRWYPKK